MPGLICIGAEARLLSTAADFHQRLETANGPPSSWPSASPELASPGTQAAVSDGFHCFINVQLGPGPHCTFQQDICHRLCLAEAMARAEPRLGLVSALPRKPVLLPLGSSRAHL